VTHKNARHGIGINVNNQLLMREMKEDGNY
jgi:hypothetical protein